MEDTTEKRTEVRQLKLGGLVTIVLALTVVLGTASAQASPHFIAPYPKAFHLGAANQRTTGEGIVPISFIAKEPEGEGAEVILTCSSFKGEGQVTGPETLTTTLVLKGCHSTTTGASASCSNGERATEIIAVPSNGELGSINSGTHTFGVRLEFNFEAVCKSTHTTYPISVKGSAIGELKPVGTRSNRFTLTFRHSGYEQVPSMFEEGAPTVLESVVGANLPEPTAVESMMFLHFAQVTEVHT